MKKYIATGVLALLLPLLANATIDTNLKYGSNGSQVTELQEFLIDKGFLTSSATGNFYSLTKKAVIAYQLSVGLPNTGYVGPMTRAQINTELSEDTTAEVNETGGVTAPVVTDTNAILKTQLDALLLQVSNLIAEQKKTTEQASQTTQAVNQVVQNTTPVFGATPSPSPAPSPVPTPSPTPTPAPIDRSDILIKLTGPFNYGDSVNNTPYGNYTVRVSVLDSSGNYTRNELIVMDAPDNIYKNTGDTEKYPNAISTNNGNDWFAGFSYVPTSLGSKTLTFTSGNLTKSITIEIK